MMNNIVTDMKAAVNLFKDMRKARREGTGVVIKQCRELPFVKSGPGFYDTPEGCNLNHCGRRIDKAAQKAFAALPYEEKRRMCFTPKAGEYVERVDFWSLGKLDFEKPDMDTFYGLKLAYEAGRRGGSLPTVFNAANERAVSLFLERQIKYLEIVEIIEDCMKAHQNIENPSLDQILDTEAATYDRINGRR